MEAVSACAIGYPVQEAASCASASEIISHFLFYQVLCIWIYVEVFNPLELTLCAWG